MMLVDECRLLSSYNWYYHPNALTSKKWIHFQKFSTSLTTYSEHASYFSYCTNIKCLARKNTIDLHWKLYLWQQIFSMYGSILRKKNESLEPRTTQLLPYWFLLSRIFSFLLPFFLIGGVSTCTASIFAHWKERGRCLVHGKIRREIYKFKRNIAQEALAKSQRCYHNAQWTFRWIH